MTIRSCPGFVESPHKPHLDETWRGAVIGRQGNVRADRGRYQIPVETGVKEGVKGNHQFVVHGGLIDFELTDIDLPDFQDFNGKLPIGQKAAVTASDYAAEWPIPDASTFNDALKLKTKKDPRRDRIEKWIDETVAQAKKSSASLPAPSAPVHDNDPKLAEMVIQIKEAKSSAELTKLLEQFRGLTKGFRAGRRMGVAAAAAHHPTWMIDYLERTFKLRGGNTHLPKALDADELNDVMFQLLYQPESMKRAGNFLHNTVQAHSPQLYKRVVDHLMYQALSFQTVTQGFTLLIDPEGITGAVFSATLRMLVELNRSNHRNSDLTLGENELITEFYRMIRENPVLAETIKELVENLSGKPAGKLILRILHFAKCGSHTDKLAAPES